jgi:hypothetical protein
MPGEIIEADVTGHDGERLTAVAAADTHNRAA